MLFQIMEYHVKWDKHERNISEAFESLRHDEHLCDITLACEGRQFQAHKVVLSAGSSFFEQVLKSHKHPCPLIYLTGVKANHMELMLDFMYSGDVALSSNMLKSFLKTADELGVKGLTLQDTKERMKCHSHNAGFKAKSSSSPKMQARAFKSVTA